MVGQVSLKAGGEKREKLATFGRSYSLCCVTTFRKLETKDQNVVTWMMGSQEKLDVDFLCSGREK